jgi:hypothetical protein
MTHLYKLNRIYTALKNTSHSRSKASMSQSRETPSPSRGRLGWGWVSVAKRNTVYIETHRPVAPAQAGAQRRPSMNGEAGNHDKHQE